MDKETTRPYLGEYVTVYFRYNAFEKAGFDHVLREGLSALLYPVAIPHHHSTLNKAYMCGKVTNINAEGLTLTAIANPRLREGTRRMIYNRYVFIHYTAITEIF